MIEYLLDNIEYISLAILVLCIAKQNIGADEFYAAHVIFWPYLWSVLFGMTEIGAAIEASSFFYLQTLYSLIVIRLLMFRINKLSVCLIALYTGYIFIHMLGWWLETYDSQGLYFYSMLALFGVEVALLMSERITNGCYRGLGGSGVLRFVPKGSSDLVYSGKGAK